MSFRLEDKEGNAIFLRESGVYLALASENRTRMIWKTTKEGFLKTVHKKNIFQSANAVGYNKESLVMIMDELHQEFVIFNVKGEIFKIDILDLLENDRYLNFKKQGFERQAFVTIGELQSWNQL